MNTKIDTLYQFLYSLNHKIDQKFNSHLLAKYINVLIDSVNCY